MDFGGGSVVHVFKQLFLRPGCPGDIEIPLRANLGDVETLQADLSCFLRVHVFPCRWDPPKSNRGGPSNSRGRFIMLTSESVHVFLYRWEPPESNLGGP